MASTILNTTNAWGVDLIQDTLCQEAITFLHNNGIPLINVHGISKEGKGCTCRRGKGCHAPGKHPQMGSRWNNKNVNHDSDWMLSQEKRRKSKIGGNLGVKTGYIPKVNKNLIVVDVDDPNNPIVIQLINEGTFAVRTGSGGYHFYFWSDRSIPNSVSKLAYRIDIRGKGGFVVAPGSFHYSGGRYLPIDKKNVPYEIKALPEYVTTLLKAKKAESNASKGTRGSKIKTSKGAYESALKDNDKTRETLKNNRISRVQNNEILKDYAWMMDCEVSQLAGRLLSESDLFVPRGMRYEVMTRLVGYEINRLVNKKIKAVTFRKNIANYRKKFVGHKKDFLASEVKLIVDGISKKHQRTHGVGRQERFDRVDGYLSFISGKGQVTDSTLRRILKDADDFFFTRCLKENELGIRDKKNFVPIRDIVALHRQWIKKCTGHNFAHSDASMAQKLREMGFYKVYWYDKPLWSCQFDESELNNEYKMHEIMHKLMEEVTSVKVSTSDTLTVTVVREKNIAAYAALTPKEAVQNMTIVNKDSSANKSVLEEPPPASTAGVHPSTIKIKRKKHPSEPRYPGRPNFEMGQALNQLLFLLTPKQAADLGHDTLILDEPGTIEDAMAIQVGDKIGIALRFENGYIPTILEVNKIHRESEVDQKQDWFQCIDRYTKSEIEFTFQELSIARALGYYEVLMRDDKLFGIPEYEEINVKISVDGKLYDPNSPEAIEALEKAAAELEAEADKSAKKKSKPKKKVTKKEKEKT